MYRGWPFKLKRCDIAIAHPPHRWKATSEVRRRTVFCLGILEFHACPICGNTHTAYEVNRGTNSDRMQEPSVWTDFADRRTRHLRKQ